MQPKALRALLTINVVLYVLWVVILKWIEPVAAFFGQHLALVPAVPDVLFEPWQLVTYNFLHLSPGFGGFLHILFNMLWLVWIGREYEETHGPHRMLAVYLITGVGGGLLTVLFYAFFEDNVVVYGASASVLGLMTMIAVKYPYKTIGLLFIGNVRLLYIVIAFLLFDIFISFGTAVTAHLGGALFGLIYAKAEQGGVDLSSWAQVFFRPRRKPKPRRAPAPSEEEGVLGRMEAWLASRSTPRKEPGRRKEASIYPMRSREREEEAPSALEREVDRILDKISEEGYEALTEEEKRVLYEASRR